VQVVKRQGGSVAAAGKGRGWYASKQAEITRHSDSSGQPARGEAQNLRREAEAAAPSRPVHRNQEAGFIGVQTYASLSEVKVRRAEPSYLVFTITFMLYGRRVLPGNQAVGRRGWCPPAGEAAVEAAAGA